MNQARTIYKCSRCRESGDILYFISKEYKLIDSKDLLKKVCDIFCIVGPSKGETKMNMSSEPIAYKENNIKSEILNKINKYIEQSYNQKEIDGMSTQCSIKLNKVNDQEIATEFKPEKTNKFITYHNYSKDVQDILKRISEVIAECEI